MADKIVNRQNTLLLAKESDRRIRNISIAAGAMSEKAKRSAAAASKNARLVEVSERYGTEKGGKKSISTIDRVLGNLARSTEYLAEGVKNITVETARGVRSISIGGAQAVSEYAKAIGEDINVNKQSMMVDAIGRVTPLIGYAVAKMMETTVFRNMIAKMKEGLGKALSSVGDRFRRLASIGWEKGKEFVASIRDKFSRSRGVATVKKKKASGAEKAYSTQREALLSAISDAKVAKEARKSLSEQAKKTKNIEKQVPHMAKGGFVTKGGMARVHAAEIVQPADKLIEQIVEMVDKRLKEKEEERKREATGDNLFKGTIFYQAKKRDLFGFEKFKSVMKTGFDIMGKRSLGLETRVFKEQERGKKGLLGSFFRAYVGEAKQHQIPLLERQVRATLEVKTAIAGQNKVAKAAWQKMLMEHPYFRATLSAAKASWKIFTFPFKGILRLRGGYKSNLSTKGTVFERTLDASTQLYVGTMEKLDDIIHNVGVAAFAANPKVSGIIPVRGRPKWRIPGRLWRFSKKGVKRTAEGLVKGIDWLRKKRGKEALSEKWTKERTIGGEAKRAYGWAREKTGPALKNLFKVPGVPSSQMSFEDYVSEENKKREGRFKRARGGKQPGLFPGRTQRLFKWMQTIAEENKKQTKTGTKSLLVNEEVRKNAKKRVEQGYQQQKIQERLKRRLKGLGDKIITALAFLWNFVSGLFKGGGGIVSSLIKGIGGIGVVKAIKSFFTKGGAKEAGKVGLVKRFSKYAGAGIKKFGGKGVEKVFGKEVAEMAAKKAASKGGFKLFAKLAGKTGLKSIAKKIPVVGLLAGIGFAAMRLAHGDVVGAGMEVASGAASLVPGAGTAASIAIDAGLVAKDVTNAAKGPSEKSKKQSLISKATATRIVDAQMAVAQYGQIIGQFTGVTGGMLSSAGAKYLMDHPDLLLNAAEKILEFKEELKTQPHLVSAAEAIVKSKTKILEYSNILKGKIGATGINIQAKAKGLMMDVSSNLPGSVGAAGTQIGTAALKTKEKAEEMFQKAKPSMWNLFYNRKALLATLAENAGVSAEKFEEAAKSVIVDGKITAHNLWANRYGILAALQAKAETAAEKAKISVDEADWKGIKEGVTKRAKAGFESAKEIGKVGLEKAKAGAQAISIWIRGAISSVYGKLHDIYMIMKAWYDDKFKTPITPTQAAATILADTGMGLYAKKGRPEYTLKMKEGEIAFISPSEAQERLGIMGGMNPNKVAMMSAAKDLFSAKMTSDMIKGIDGVKGAVETGSNRSSSMMSTMIDNSQKIMTSSGGGSGSIPQARIQDPFVNAILAGNVS